MVVHYAISRRSDRLLSGKLFLQGRLCVTMTHCREAADWAKNSRKRLKDFLNYKLIELKDFLNYKLIDK